MMGWWEGDDKAGGGSVAATRLKVDLKAGAGHMLVWSHYTFRQK
jgi:hypothetical protein